MLGFYGALFAENDSTGEGGITIAQWWKEQFNRSFDADWQDSDKFDFGDTMVAFISVGCRTLEVDVDLDGALVYEGTPERVAQTQADHQKFLDKVKRCQTP